LKIPNGRENVEIGRITDNTINDQTKKDKKINNDGQNITEKTKDQPTYIYIPFVLVTIPFLGLNRS
jgi:hypothetical protein